MDIVKKEVFTVLVGGSAGNGVKKIGAVLSSFFASMGRHAFEMEDYQSLIKGGHNFCVVSTSIEPIYSHYEKKDIIVTLDERSYKKHKDEATQDGVVVYNSDLVKNADENHIGIPLTTFARKYPNPELRLGVSVISVLFGVLGLSKEELANIIKDNFKDVENNISFANEVYDFFVDHFKEKRIELEKGNKTFPVVSGNEAIPLGAYAGGLDMFFAYPMTPASTILHFLASHTKDFGIGVMHPENEIAVINMAIGAASVGLKTMVASSGGGFALMEEAISLAGMTETPILAVLSSRPGPSTGVPTYTEQGDLYFALNQGHGEFPKIVASPGTHEEAFYLASDLLALAWEFQTVSILLTEKHLSESRKTFEIDLEKSSFADYMKHTDGEYLRYKLTDSGVSPLLFPPSESVIKFSSYEHDEYGLSTEDPEMITKMHDKRFRKYNSIVQKLKTMKTVNVYNTQLGENTPVIFTYGSTTMSVLEALKFGKIEARVIQPIYLEPFPSWELDKFKGVKSYVVEQSVMGSFERLLKEKAGIKVNGHIKKYDGRPFEVESLSKAIKEVLA
ncbi:putative 2-oxoglutarate ferredoxin oxidoreductase alpha subunit [Caldisericum exile AZM16c01]|uniref:2-oxoglutarate ferredoxin oxidoreductase alpha subunit n=1 Tax=Caldisericum exile (strain DSM 21853 / NBRC 104410 / AZM16c01) TaxID=511051 RepID=A0A7U6GDF2_CALEA|nr:2-oxoacid:acceptor oxidoreductase subunit alpha [Caldisericum exile]BAL80311.1 putative 2-oxoglutarate ferredoxin oxidoreductase alpha subunit [Caldisericum exile AZM16c01]